jgi:hypothetical protein
MSSRRRLSLEIQNSINLTIKSCRSCAPSCRSAFDGAARACKTIWDHPLRWPSAAGATPPIARSAGGGGDTGSPLSTGSLPTKKDFGADPRPSEKILTKFQRRRVPLLPQRPTWLRQQELPLSDLCNAQKTSRDGCSGDCNDPCTLPHFYGQHSGP